MQDTNLGENVEVVKFVRLIFHAEWIAFRQFGYVLTASIFIEYVESASISNVGYGAPAGYAHVKPL